MYRSFLGAAFLVLSFACLASAQRAPSAGGGANSGDGFSTAITTLNSRNATQTDLQVRLTWPNGRAVEDIVHIQLLTATDSPVMDLFSRQGEGMVTLHGVVPGRYILKLDGQTIKDVVTDVFGIDPHQGISNQLIEVSPKENANANNGAGGGAMISAVELNAPPKAQAEYEKGMEAMAKGDLAKAEEKFRKAIEIYPKYGRAWSNLGVVRIRQKDVEGARQAWLKALEVDDKLVSAHLNLARLDLGDKKLTDAAARIDKALAIDPNNVEGLSLLAHEQFLAGQYDKAVATVHRVHSMPHERLAEVHLIAGDALQRENQPAEAIKEYELYLEEDPNGALVAKVRAAMAQLEASRQNQPKNGTN